MIETCYDKMFEVPPPPPPRLGVILPLGSHSNTHLGRLIGHHSAPRPLHPFNSGLPHDTYIGLVPIPSFLRAYTPLLHHLMYSFRAPIGHGIPPTYLQLFT